MTGATLRMTWLHVFVPGTVLEIKNRKTALVRGCQLCTQFSRDVALRVEIEIAESHHLRPLAASRLELAGAATCGHSLGSVWGGHLRPLAGKCLGRPLAATHLERIAAELAS